MELQKNDDTDCPQSSCPRDLSYATLFVGSGDSRRSARAPVKAIEQLGASPDRGFCYIPVVNGNCVFNRKGGEQPETKEQSVMKMNSIRPSLSGSVRAMREPLTARHVPDETRLRVAE